MPIIAKPTMSLILQNLKRGRFVMMHTRAAQGEAKACEVDHVRRSLHRPSLQERLKSQLPNNHQSSPSIYRVPKNLRQVENIAYTPTIVSIGPYYHGKRRLRAMEEVKWRFFRRLFNPEEQKDAELDNVIKAMKDLEEEARLCYSENCRMSSDSFIDMAILDGCFIVELFREVGGELSPDGQNNEQLAFTDFCKQLIYGKPKTDDQPSEECTPEPEFLKRWMPPILRQDLIMLENQLPLSVLRKLFELTDKISNYSTNASFEGLALDFFNPLMVKIDSSPKPIDSNNNWKDAKHLLDLFRSNILPEKPKRGEESYLFRSMVELKEAGIKVRKKTKGQLLDISFDSDTGVLKIPHFCFNDYKCTLYRNMIAFEQCHKACKPDVTRYLLFLDGLINSAKDVELLHYAGVLQHSFGDNKQLARTVNRLCKEVSRDMKESYMYGVVNDIYEHCNKFLKRNRAYAVHNYFTNIWVATSTIAAIFLIYLTVLQTCFSLAQLQNSSTPDFWLLLGESLRYPFPWLRCDFCTSGDLEDQVEPMFEPF